jgi:hypothetical protein
LIVHASHVLGPSRTENPPTRAVAASRILLESVFSDSLAPVAAKNPLISLEILAAADQF